MAGVLSNTPAGRLYAQSQDYKTDTTGHSFKKVSTYLGKKIDWTYTDAFFYCDSTLEFSFKDSTFSKSFRFCGPISNYLPLYAAALYGIKDIWFRKYASGGSAVTFTYLVKSSK